MTMTDAPGPRLRLLADDLTGALDTAAELTALCGLVEVLWDGMTEAASPPGSVALDSGTREATRDAAIARVGSLAPALAGAGIAYKKVDSLLRGHVAAELAACLRLGAWRHCVLAPAFPAQGRITRGGRLMVGQPEGGWSPAGERSLPDMLAAEGLPAKTGRTDAPLPPGIAVFDAVTEEDLARLATLGRAAQGPVLWCGSGGLARALAGEAKVRPSTLLEAPVLGLFGSDQAVTARQLAASGPSWLRIAEGGSAGAADIARRMAATGVALASLDLPPGLARDDAARRIEAAFVALAHCLPRPGTLIAAGGETLRALCRGLGARSLRTAGLIAPGIPRSVMQGGAWDGVAVVSKSGAFGTDALWRDLLGHNGLPIGSIHQ
ncbi:four-carbon acid sugar kinase family protein [Belnapia sp. F-4-1]|uniref:four-carbon acid sugar kinase family protein n=1 Tax=Belnapia sp. F-4-1 TaxID=1545443 RepID=UPI0005B99330|nr:four-carbon acid sugar kinase family protein [Belnapia sp. F-4-1]